MSLRLGLDTGGTCTDAALVDAAGRVLASAKAPTSHGALIEGLRAAARAALAGVDAGGGAARRVTLVSLSTTLATNALVEGRGRPAGLVLIGARPSVLARPELVAALGDDPVVLVAGGHDAAGNPQAPLDVAALEGFARAHAARVEAWAVSSVFAVRNPAHERQASELLHALAGLPVTSGHELATALDAPRRAVTAYLNARLVPAIAALVDAAVALLDELGIEAPLTVVRGDGTLVSAALARERPVETILSGPAASVVGACALAGIADGTVVDTGGTTSDVAQLVGGLPRLAADGARIGGHRTMVRAIEVTTVGLGGDSEVRADVRIGGESVEGIVSIGPARVVPLSVLVERWPRCLDVLRAQRDRGHARSTDGTFVVRVAGGRVPALSPALAGTLACVGDEPVALEALAARSGLGAGTERAIGKLEARGLVRRAGVAPTDAALVLGDPRRGGGGSAAAAMLGLELLLRAGARAADALALARAIEREMALRIALTCAADAMATPPGPDRLAWLGDAMVAAAAGTASRLSLRPRLGVPLVGVGGPAHRHHPAAAALLDTDCLLPEHGAVANAVGAVAGVVRVERRVTVLPDGPGALRVLLPSGPVRAATLEAAAALAADVAGRDAREAALAAGASEPAVTLRRDDTVVQRDGLGVLIESVTVATAVGRPLEARAAGPERTERRPAGPPGTAR